MIGLIGLNYRSAPLNVREQFVLEEGEIGDFIESIKERDDYSEYVILATCNRMEIYFNLSKECMASNFDYILKKLFGLLALSQGF